MSERLDVRLSEEEKKRLAELAKQKDISMTDLVRLWIMRGDVVHVLAEQLQDFTNDFAKWHVLGNNYASIRYLCKNLRDQTGNVDVSKRTMIYKWIGFFNRSFQLEANDISDLSKRLNKFIKQKEPKEKTVLIDLIIEFKEIVTLYHNAFVQGFIDILLNMDEKTQEYIGQRYNDEFRTRYNEITSKFEDFLKRAERELGKGLEQAMPRAKEFRAKG